MFFVFGVASYSMPAGFMVAGVLLVLLSVGYMRGSD